MSRDEIKYPEIDVELSDKIRKAAATSIMAAVGHALRKHKVAPGEIAEFYEECLDGTYDDLLPISKRWVRVL